MQVLLGLPCSLSACFGQQQAAVCQLAAWSPLTRQQPLIANQLLCIAVCRCCLPYVSSVAGQKWMNMLFHRLVMKARYWSGINPFGDRWALP